MYSRLRTSRMLLVCVSLSLILTRVASKIDSEGPVAELLEPEYEDLEITSSKYKKPEHSANGSNSSGPGKISRPNNSTSNVEKYKAQLQEIEEETDRIQRFISELENQNPSSENEISDSNLAEVDAQSALHVITMDKISSNASQPITTVLMPQVTGNEFNESQLQHAFQIYRNFVVAKNANVGKNFSSTTEVENRNPKSGKIDDSGFGGKVARNILNSTIGDVAPNISTPIAVTISPDLIGPESRENVSKYTQTFYEATTQVNLKSEIPQLEPKLKNRTTSSGDGSGHSNLERIHTQNIPSSVMHRASEKTVDLDINSIIDPIIADALSGDSDVKMIKGKPVKQGNLGDNDYENRRDNTHESSAGFRLSEQLDVKKHKTRLLQIERKESSLQELITKLENQSFVGSESNDLEEYDETTAEVPRKVIPNPNPVINFGNIESRKASDAYLPESNKFVTEIGSVGFLITPGGFTTTKKNILRPKIAADSVNKTKADGNIIDFLTKLHEENTKDIFRQPLLKKSTTQTPLLKKRTHKQNILDLEGGEGTDTLEKREVEKPLHYFGHIEPFRLKQLGRTFGTEDEVRFGQSDTPFGLQKCSDRSLPKVDFEKPSYLKPGETASGYLHVTLKSPSLVSKFAIQFVTDRGVFFGNPWEVGSIKCDDANEPNWNSEKMNTIITNYEMPKRNKATDKVMVSMFEFKIPKKEFHFGWRHTETENEELLEGFQIQSFTVFSVSPSCFVQSFTKLYEGNSQTFRKDLTTEGEYNCHVGQVDIPRASTSNPLTLHPKYKKLVELARDEYRSRRGFCARGKLFGTIPICDSPGKSDILEFNVFRVSPETHGWVHLVIKVKESPANQNIGLYRFVVQAVTRSGFIAGKWLGKSKGCKDENNATAEIARRPKSVSYFSMPKHPPSKRNPTAVGIEFESQHREARLFWKYNAEEAVEVSKDIQFHVYLQPFKHECYLEAFSPIFTLPAFSHETELSIEFRKRLPHTCMDPNFAVVSKDPMNVFHVNEDYFQRCRNSGPIKGTPAIIPPTTKPPGVPVKAPKVIEEDPEDEEHKDYRLVKFPKTQSHAENIVFNRRVFYEGCSENKGCFGDPKNCIKSRSCKVAVSYRRKTDRCLFEVMAETGKYVAMGLSRDQLMDQDMVIECVRESNNIRVYASVNTISKKHFRMRNHSSLSFLKGSYESGLLYCEFENLRKTKFRTLEFDLAAEKYYILLARGDTGRDGPRGDIFYHARGQVASPEKYILMEQFGKSLTQIILADLHAISFVLTWLVLIPTSTFMVRYFKETYVDRYICKYSIWFGIHFQMMIVSVILTTIGFISVGISKGEMTQDVFKGFHKIGGVILVIIIFIQMLMGIVLSWWKRELKWLHHIHSVIGHAEFMFGVVILYRSKEIRFGLPCQSSTVIIVYCVCYTIVHAIMSYQVCYIDFIQGEFISRVYTSPGLRPAHITELESEAPGGSARKFMLYSFIIMETTLCGVIIYMYLADYKDCEELRLSQALEIPDYED